mmetsp:Transcript_5196/g.8823  ORF Transcript_5196/g.8823 Transcript_5196/m.8823 type:complete len:267 (-) Transcript_5196:75-875(-)
MSFTRTLIFLLRRRLPSQFGESLLQRDCLVDDDLVSFLSLLLLFPLCHINLLPHSLHLLPASLLHLQMQVLSAMLGGFHFPLSDSNGLLGVLLAYFLHLPPAAVHQLGSFGVILSPCFDLLGLVLAMVLDVSFVLGYALLELLESLLLDRLPQSNALLRLKALVEDPRLLPLFSFPSLRLHLMLLGKPFFALFCHVCRDDHFLLPDHLRHGCSGFAGGARLLEISLIVFSRLFDLLLHCVLQLSLSGADEVLRQLSRLPFKQSISR